MLPFLRHKTKVAFKVILPRDKQGEPNPAYPSDLYCKAGHYASEGSLFFKVSGDIDRSLWGLYCENCIKAMNIIRRLKKEKEEENKRRFMHKVTRFGE